MATQILLLYFELTMANIKVIWLHQFLLIPHAASCQNQLKPFPYYILVYTKQLICLRLHLFDKITQGLVNKMLEYYCLSLFHLFQYQPAKCTLRVNNCRGFVLAKCLSNVFAEVITFKQHMFILEKLFSTFNSWHLTITKKWKPIKQWKKYLLLYNCFSFYLQMQ